MKNKKDARTITSSDGVEVYYWLNKNPSMTKSAIVMHPGASMNHGSLQGLERGLNEAGHPTVLIDQRGIGYSEAPPKREFYALNRYSEDLQKIIEQEGLNKPDIFTHSFGFMVATDYLLRTGNLGKITGTCASYNFQKTSNPFLVNFGAKVLGCSDYIIWAGNWLSHKLAGKKVDYSEQDLAGKSDLAVAHALAEVPLKELLVHRANTGLGNWDISEKLKHVENPIQLIYGKHDLMVRPYAGDVIKKLVKGKCDVSIVEGTHTLPTTHPERVLGVMKYKD